MRLCQVVEALKDLKSEWKGGVQKAEQSLQ
jgi:hypothetical protein